MQKPQPLRSLATITREVDPTAPDRARVITCSITHVDGASIRNLAHGAIHAVPSYAGPGAGVPYPVPRT